MLDNQNNVNRNANCSTYNVPMDIQGAARHPRAHAHGRCAHAHMRATLPSGPISDRALKGGGVRRFGPHAAKLMPGLKIDGTRAHLHGIAAFKRQHVSTECALWVMLGARAPYPVYTRHTRRGHGVYPAYLLALSS